MSAVKHLRCSLSSSALLSFLFLNCSIHKHRGGGGGLKKWAPGPGQRGDTVNQRGGLEPKSDEEDPTRDTSAKGLELEH